MLVRNGDTFQVGDCSAVRFPADGGVTKRDRVLAKHVGNTREVCDLLGRGSQSAGKAAQTTRQAKPWTPKAAATRLSRERAYERHT